VPAPVGVAPGDRAGTGARPHPYMPLVTRSGKRIGVKLGVPRGAFVTSRHREEPHMLQITKLTLGPMENNV